MDDTGQRIYKFSIPTWFQLWLVSKTYLWFAIVIADVIAVIWSIFTRTGQDISMAEALFMFVAMNALGIAISMYFARRQFFQSKQYQIGLEQDRITLYQSASPIATFHRDEITTVTKIEWRGLYISSAEQRKYIRISPLMEEYDEIVAQVLAWHPPHQLGGDWIYRVPQPVYGVMFVIGLSLVVVGATRWTVGLGVILVMAMIVVVFNDTRRATRRTAYGFMLFYVGLSICSICRLIALL